MTISVGFSSKEIPPPPSKSVFLLKLKEVLGGVTMATGGHTHIMFIQVLVHENRNLIN